MAAKGTRRKDRITVSLDRDTTRYLRQFRARTHAPSLSACLEELITKHRRDLKVELQNLQINAYYESMSEQETQEEAAWGEFAEGELAGGEQ